MKRSVVLGALVLALAGTSAAKAQSAFDWSGFYLGGGAGYAWGGITNQFGPGAGGLGPPGMWAPDPTGSSFTEGVNGGLYGIHAGYLQQWGRLVAGIEASFDLSDLQGRATNPFPGLLPTTGYYPSLKWLATVTPRIGYAWNNVQVYGKAGIALGRVGSSLTADINACGGAPPCSFYGESTHVGFTVGVGGAYALTPNWVLGVEYDYYDLGSESYGGQTTPNTSWNVGYQLQPKFSAVRGRISYRFGGPAPASPDSAPVAPEPNMPPSIWQGFYVGANLGYGWSSNGYSAPPGGSGNGGSGPAGGLFFPELTGGGAGQSGTGGLYGLHAGFNQQWDRLVGGLELSVALSDVSARSNNLFGAQTDPGSAYTTNLKWLATLAPRLGMSWDRVLVYAKGGVAVGRFSSQLNSSNVMGCNAGGFGGNSACSFYEERTHIGVVVGGGLEYRLTPSLSLGVEYSYMNFSTEAYGGTISPNTTWSLSYGVQPQLSTLTGRLSYRL